MIRLMINNHTPKQGYKPGNKLKFDAWVEGKYLGSFHSPLFQVARMLIDEGHDPETLYTMRWEGKDFDSFRPMRLGVAAKLTVAEPDARSVHIKDYVPFGGLQ